ncbi:hypothetical protein ZWY2020_005748 [Hordeum vulgare]|nr:hypothetical protein ZWY2020_005748 [Hordeum vulgare]
MESSAVAQCWRDKCILITGSTGYLGKLLVEKILHVQPAVKKLYLLVRAPDAMSAGQRVLSEVTGKDSFNLLRRKYGIIGFQNFIKEKVVPLAGDIMDSYLGLDNSRVDALSEELDVIINVAATTSFYERYDVALACNALGARNVCQFAKRCLNLKLFLHVSSGYVASTQNAMLLEKALQSGETLKESLGLDVEVELQLIENVKNEHAALKKIDSSAPPKKFVMRKLGLQRACHFGWPNVYAFTKAIGETLIGLERGDLPVVIVRHTMVTSPYEGTFPGWIEGARTIDALIAAYNEQVLPCFIANRDDMIDVQMECPNCFDKKSLCTDNGLDNNYFYLKLTKDFKFMTCIACFARADQLNKLKLTKDEETTTTAFLKTKEGFYFKVIIQNGKEHTFFGFGCLNWREFAKDYNLEVGMELSTYICQQTNRDIWVDLDKFSIIPPYYFRVPRETQRMVDNIYYTAGTIVTLEEMKEVIRFLDSIKAGVRHYRAGISFGPYVPLAHTLSMTNITKKYLEIPTPCLPQQMPANGDMRIIIHDKTNFTCTYSTSVHNGCIIVNGWGKLLETYHIEIGDRLIAVIHHGPRGPFLFLTSIFESVLQYHLN